MLSLFKFGCRDKSCMKALGRVILTLFDVVPLKLQQTTRYCVPLVFWWCLAVVEPLFLWNLYDVAGTALMCFTSPWEKRMIWLSEGREGYCIRSPVRSNFDRKLHYEFKSNLTVSVKTRRGRTLLWSSRGACPRQAPVLDINNVSFIQRHFSQPTTSLPPRQRGKVAWPHSIVCSSDEQDVAKRND